MLPCLLELILCMLKKMLEIKVQGMTLLQDVMVLLALSQRIPGYLKFTQGMEGTCETFGILNETILTCGYFSVDICVYLFTYLLILFVDFFTVLSNNKLK